MYILISVAFNIAPSWFNESQFAQIKRGLIVSLSNISGPELPLSMGSGISSKGAFFHCDYEEVTNHELFLSVLSHCGQLKMVVDSKYTRIEPAKIMARIDQTLQEMARM